MSKTTKNTLNIIDCHKQKQENLHPVQMDVNQIPFHLLSPQQKWYQWIKYYLPNNICKLIFWSCLIVVNLLAILPGEKIPNIFIFNIWDKGQHFIAFFILALLGSWIFPWRTLNLVIFLLLFGAGIECMQYFIPWRTAELFDFLADMLGILAGVAVAYLIVIIDI
ncbi:MAG: VanZ family protein [Magnetococcus sp. YQC-5]